MPTKHEQSRQDHSLPSSHDYIFKHTMHSRRHIVDEFPDINMTIQQVRCPVSDSFIICQGSGLPGTTGVQARVQGPQICKKYEERIKVKNEKIIRVSSKIQKYLPVNAVSSIEATTSAKRREALQTYKPRILH